MKGVFVDDCKGYHSNLTIHTNLQRLQYAKLKDIAQMLSGPSKGHREGLKGHDFLFN